MESIEGVWSPYLERHFPEERWRYYHDTIMYYTLAVNMGLKPSFMWDFGPRPTNADQITAFVQDLKENNIISRDIVVVLLRWRVFIAKVPHLLQALEENIFVTDISARNESGWFLGFKNDFVVYVSEYMTRRLTRANFQDTGRVQFDFERHFPTVYGLVLGYPFTYYTEHMYRPISFHLHFYRVICKFRFGNTSQDFPIYVFSIPRSLFTPMVGASVDDWFERLKSKNTTGFELIMDQWEEYFDATHGGMR